MPLIPRNMIIKAAAEPAIPPALVEAVGAGPGGGGIGCIPVGGTGFGEFMSDCPLVGR